MNVLDLPPPLLDRLQSVLAQRSRGPAEIWGEVVDHLNAAGIEPPGP